MDSKYKTTDKTRLSREERFKLEYVDIDSLIEVLPRGSGINGDWNLITQDKDKIILENFYHCMDENGFYDGYLPLRLTIFRRKNNAYNKLKDGRTQVLYKRNDIDFRVRFRESAKPYLYGMKEYFYSIFYDALNDNGYLTERKFTILD